MSNEIEKILREVLPVDALSEVQIATRLVLEAERFPDCESRRLAVEAGRRILAGCNNVRIVEVPVAATSKLPIRVKPYPSISDELDEAERISAQDLVDCLDEAECIAAHDWVLENTAAIRALVGGQAVVAPLGYDNEICVIEGLKDGYSVRRYGVPEGRLDKPAKDLE